MQFKIGIYNLKTTKNNGINGIDIDNGWSSQHVIFYGSECKNKWACDFPEKLPGYIVKFLNTITF